IFSHIFRVEAFVPFARSLNRKYHWTNGRVYRSAPPVGALAPGAEALPTSARALPWLEERMTELTLRPAANGVLVKPAADALLSVAWEKISGGRVEEGMSGLLPELQARRLKAPAEEWAAFVRRCLDHPLRGLLHQDPFTRRAFAKPRGYAGDAELLDFIYGREEGWPAPADTTELGRQVFEFTTRSAACEAVRARRGFVAEMVDRLCEEVPRPHVLSLAAGHLR